VHASLSFEGYKYEYELSMLALLALMYCRFGLPICTTSIVDAEKPAGNKRNWLFRQSQV